MKSDEIKCCYCRLVYKNDDMGIKVCNGEYYKTCKLCRYYLQLYNLGKRVYENEKLESDERRCYYCGNIIDNSDDMSNRINDVLIPPSPYRCKRCVDLIKNRNAISNRIKVIYI